jgi:hypothetical protein
MTDDYLWDKTGSNAEIERLERVLRPLRLDHERTPIKMTARRRQWPALIAACAAALALAVTGWSMLDRGRGYTVATENENFVAKTGSWIGKSGEQRTITIADIGTVVAEADTRLKIICADDQLHKLRLERGTIHASISANAKPRLFQVETPSTTCVDLGCMYSLSVDDNGETFVRVTVGQVAFVANDREYFVPAGAHCSSHAQRGIGAPVWDDAGEALETAVKEFDRSAPPERLATAHAVIANATRDKDVLTLWHLFHNRDRAIIEIAVDALRTHCPFPAGRTREQLIAHEPSAVAEWQRALSTSAKLGPPPEPTRVQQR